MSKNSYGIETVKIKISKEDIDRVRKQMSLEERLLLIEEKVQQIEEKLNNKENNINE